ncbi:hypothetical protein [Echinicola rosea]|uniref:hypothetical protein n=1 Tax=Echinicola rosea TaxID=1807691 RepID=UPI0010CA65FF|nr:hypothetical protein [Echinicola rosea]
MPIFQPMVEAVKKGSWLASWNSETHSLLDRSHRVEIKMGDRSTSPGKSMSHFKGQTTGLDFLPAGRHGFLSFSSIACPEGFRRKKVKGSHQNGQSHSVKAK